MRYVYVRYVVNKEFKPYYLNYNLDVSAVSDDEMLYFGYYIVSPENDKNQVIYCVPKGDEIGIYCNDNGKITHLDNTKSFNLQQGCMLQWGYTNTNHVYYNTYNSLSKRYESIIYDIEKGDKLSTFHLPIYALSKQEDYFLSLNFDRLTLMRPDYGYFCNDNIKLPSNTEDGIWYYDINLKQSSLIITLQQLIDLKYVETMDGAQHKVNHIDIAPDGKRFMFLHRWVGKKGRFMRLITCNSDGSNLYILNGDKMTSHSYWVDDEHIVSFCNTEKYNNAYVIFKDKSSEYNLVTEKLPTNDGHPSTILNGKWIITDTYPNLGRMSSLLLYNTKQNKLYKLGHFYQPLKYNGQKRIDLHPKWNMLGNSVYFESGHTGKRRLYKINLTNIIDGI
ncbi:MAG: hypothetical protein R3Y26_11270 [Rikenellaceae bacterium]